MIVSSKKLKVKACNQYIIIRSQESVIDKIMKPIESSKQPTSNSQQPTQNGTQPISNFKRNISNSLEQIGLNKFTANFTQKSLAASQKYFFLSLLTGILASLEIFCDRQTHTHTQTDTHFCFLILKVNSC